MAFYHKYEQTIDGHELVWQTNYLSSFYYFNIKIKLIEKFFY